MNYVFAGKRAGCRGLNFSLRTEFRQNLNIQVFPLGRVDRRVEGMYCFRNVIVWRSTLLNIPDDFKLSDTSLWNGMSYIKRVCRWYCHKKCTPLYPCSSGKEGSLKNCSAWGTLIAKFSLLNDKVKTLLCLRGAVAYFMFGDLMHYRVHFYINMPRCLFVSWNVTYTFLFISVATQVYVYFHVFLPSFWGCLCSLQGSHSPQWTC